MAYRIEIRNSARKEIAALPRQEQARVVAAIARLADNPRLVPARKLAGADNAWRIRVGVYRVLYQVVDDMLVIVVVRVGHRREVYRGL